MKNTIEYFDILDEDGNRTGESLPSKEVHSRGLPHRTVHVWVVNSKNQILLQKRSAAMTAYPNTWDISSAGHISAGETSLEGAKKELREELGLEPPNSAFRFISTFREKAVIAKGIYLQNDFQDMYLVRLDLEIHEFILQKEEVIEVRWISLSEFKEWIKGNGEPLVPHLPEYLKLIELLES